MALAGLARTLVMPLDDLSSEPTRAWVGEAFAEAISSHLEAAGRDVVRLSELHGHLEEMGLSPGVPVTRATVIVLGRELRAARAVVGSYEVDRGRIEVSVKVLDLERGAIIGVIEDHDKLENLLVLESQFAKNLFRLEKDPLPASFEASAARRRRIPLEAHEKMARARMEPDHSERRRLLEAALEMCPDYTEAELALGWVLLATHHPIDAVRLLSSVDPDNYAYREAYFLMGLAYLEANQTAAAAEIFTHLARQEAAAPFFNNLGVAVYRRGDTESAVEWFRRALEKSEDPIYLFNLGWVHWRAGKGGEALRVFRELVQRRPEDGQAHFLLAAAAASQALTEEAQQERARAIALSPELAEVDASTVEGLERVDRRLPPRSGGGAVAAVGPSTEPAQDLLERARAHRASGQLGEAKRELQRVLYLEPHWTEARLELAALYKASGELEKAVGEYRVALWDEDSLTAHLGLAKLYLEMGNEAQARFHAEKALELDPDNTEADGVLKRLKEPGSGPSLLDPLF